MMKIDNDILCAVESDLGLNTQISKGQLYPIKNCWHYSTDGNQVDYLFIDDEDFIAGINRLYVTTTKYKVLLLAFSLMNTHIHLIIWGDFHESERFIFEYLKLTSMYLCMKYGDKHKLIKLIPQHQKIGSVGYHSMRWIIHGQAVLYTLEKKDIGRHATGNTFLLIPHNMEITNCEKS